MKSEHLDDREPESRELTDFEHRLARKSRRLRISVLVGAGLLLAGAAWAAMDMISRTVPEPEPLERCLSGSFVRMQVRWFRTLASSGQYNRALHLERTADFDRSMTIFLEEVKSIDHELAEPMQNMIEALRALEPAELDTPDGLDELRSAVHEVNEALAGASPPIYLDVEPFQGLLDRDYLQAAMILVYEILDTEVFLLREEDPSPISLRVVRRLDSLPPDPERQGYVREDDADAAFILQGNATSFAADHIIPGVLELDQAFSSFFDRKLPGRLAEPYGALLELVGLELREAMAIDEETFIRLADLLADRSRIVLRLESAAQASGVHLRRPPGLTWPRSFLSLIRDEEIRMAKRGSSLLSAEDLDTLLSISAELEEPEYRRPLERLTDLLVTTVGFHEARHVADVRAGLRVGSCIRRQVRLRDDDPDFLTDIELECRAYVTQLIQAPETRRMSLFNLLNHLYQRRGTATFYAARTVLHGLAFSHTETDIPRHFDYLEEIAVRLAALDSEEIARRAWRFHEECLGPYEPLIRLTDQGQNSAGCSL